MIIIQLCACGVQIGKLPVMCTDGITAIAENDHEHSITIDIRAVFDLKT